ncbi:MAG UNVERIFIED_CONTAM: hypothetical protein LVR18_28605 [Planctomycetaceae bacterium]
MARMARSEYFTADENAVLFIRCRAHRPLIPSSDQGDANAGHRRVGYIEDLIRLYARHFAISVHAHAVTHNEIRLVLQSRPELLSAVDDAQIARRWLSACPTLRRGRTLSDEPSEKEIRALCENPSRIAQLRHQLSDISWWMRLLQQRVAQHCNREDNQTGTFWQSRFRSVLLLDAMSHLAAIANVDLAAVSVKMGKPISASTFTSDVYRRMELQNESEMHTSSLQSDSPEVSSNSAAALPEVLTDVTTTVRRDGRHLAPIFPSDQVANIAARLAGWINQLRCSDESVLNMKLRHYVELLERTTQGCPSDQRELSSVDLPPILGSLQLTFDQWVQLAAEFDKLFSHVAGQLAAMDACVSKRSRRRACVRPAARSLLHCSNAC